MDRGWAILKYWMMENHEWQMGIMSKNDRNLCTCRDDGRLWIVGGLN
jgi:hypothetical protein